MIKMLLLFILFFSNFVFAVKIIPEIKVDESGEVYQRYFTVYGSYNVNRKKIEKLNYSLSLQKKERFREEYKNSDKYSLNCYDIDDKIIFSKNFDFIESNLKVNYQLTDLPEGMKFDEYTTFNILIKNFLNIRKIKIFEGKKLVKEFDVTFEK